MQETDPRPREDQAWRGWLSLALCPTVAGIFLWQSLALLAGQREPLTTRFGIVIAPGFLVGAGVVMIFATIWIALKERAHWPVGFEPGHAKTIGFGILLLSSAVMASDFLIAAIGQARLVGW